MSREIKFRGMDVDGGYMVYGSLLNAIDGDFIVNDIKVFNDPTLVVGENYAINVHSSTVGQFTGLKDKNGVDVYEGDIVLIDDTFHVVKFFEGGFVLFANNDEDAWVNGWEDLRALIWCGVVYGNIHENIELLGGQNA